MVVSVDFPFPENEVKGPVARSFTIHDSPGFSLQLHDSRSTIHVFSIWTRLTGSSGTFKLRRSSDQERLMERIRFISHEGNRILLVDCAGCNAQELAAISDEVPKVVRQEPEASTLLLADFTGTQVTREGVERLKIAAALDKKHLKRSAWVFDGNFPKPLFESVKAFTQRDIRIFEKREEALKYLVA